MNIYWSAYARADVNAREEIRVTDGLEKPPPPPRRRVSAKQFPRGARQRGATIIGY